MENTLDIQEYSPIIKSQIWHYEIGNTHGFWFSSTGKPRVVIGPHWMYCLISVLLFTIIFGTLLLFSSYFVPRIMSTISWVAYCTCLTSWLISGLKNPGLELEILTNQQEITKYFNDKKFCRVCEVLREPGTLHCVECDVCIKEKQSHSLIVGKCIGKEIKVPYYILIGSIIFLASYIGFIAVYAIFI
ncbi:unnamed protein product [Blepharisma stoltei]|uniref:Palmitoyltransferase n=1 Tax=Blepharisma stoltei TaxID=1481888 RepID=A0AAU9K5Q1_9CILI|nr:unnamed protein product [Blepharisma stoltei]